MPAERPDVTRRARRAGGQPARRVLHSLPFKRRAPRPVEIGRLSRIEARLAPWLGRGAAPERDSIVKPERPVVPELHLDRGEPEPRPVGRAGNVANAELCSEPGNGLFQREAALERARLKRGPGADAARAWAAREIGIRFLL